MYIEYGSSIKIVNNKGKEVIIPYGKINTKKFQSFRQSHKKSNTLQEKYRFSAIKKVIPEKKTLNIKGFPPRDYQKEALQHFFHPSRVTGILKAPTGAGKGSIIAYMIAQKNLSTLVIVPTSDLVYQTAQRIRSIVDIPWNMVGEIGERKQNLDAPIIVSTWQSLAVDNTFLYVFQKGFGMLICDEVHKASAPVLNSIISRLPILYKFGMSATPYRTKEEQMEKVYDQLGEVIFDIDIELLYDNGFLLRPSIAYVGSGIDISFSTGIRSYFHEKLANNKGMRYVFAKKLFSKEFQVIAPKSRTIEDIVNNPLPGEWKLLSTVAGREYEGSIDEKVKSGEMTEDDAFMAKVGLSKSGIEINETRMKKTVEKALLMFSETNEKGIVLFHTKYAGYVFEKEMKKNGYDNVIVINGDIPNKSELIKSLTDGSTKNYIVASTVSLLSEGNDIPSLEKILLAAPSFPPFTDIGRMQQIIGRAVRPDPNNPSKKPIVVIIKDFISGWIQKKREAVMEHIREEFHPDFVEFDDFFKISEYKDNDISSELIENKSQDGTKIASLKN